MTDFVKSHPGAPADYFGWEAAGLRWLASVDGGVPCAQVVSVDAAGLTLRRLESVTPTPEAARVFGRQLAVTH
ncbi:MAG: fructosamine kinase, partial [Mycobacterium sp.]